MKNHIMNKGIITLLLFGLFAGTAFAQEAAEKKPRKKLFKKKSQVVEEVTSPLLAPNIQDKPAPKAQPTVVEDMKAPVEAAEVDENAPVFKFSEESFDFGNQIIDGEKKTHVFNFTNEGKSPLIIEKVKASCGCTTPSWPKTPIAPGETGEITATYNSKGRIGKFNKAVRITSNAATPTKVLYIKGEVQKVNQEEGLPVKKPSIVEESN